MKESSVCIVGVLDNPASTNVSMAHSFIKLGINVLPVNYRTVISNLGMPFFEDYLINLVKRHQPKLVLFSKCNGVNPEIVAECSKFAKTWLFNMDPQATIERCPEVIDHARNSHFSSCTGEDIVEWFESFGVKNCYHIIQGTDQDVFRPVEPVDELKADISFIGAETEERVKMLKYLEDLGYVVRSYGVGFSDKEMVNLDFSKVCASSRFMLSMNTYNNVHRGYFSNRLVRYLSCGACTLHYDTTGSLDKFFDHNKEVFYFGDVEELTHLMMTDNETACRVAMAGRDKVLNNYTWDHIIRHILKIAFDNNPI